MKIIKRIKKILVISLAIFLINSLSISCNKKTNNDNNKLSYEIPSDYSIEKAIEVNSLSNLLKETGYFSFSFKPVTDVLNKCYCYAHDKYLIFKISDSNISIVTDKSSAYVVENNNIKEHRKINNYDQNSFIIDKSLHDIVLKKDVMPEYNILIDRYLSSKNNCINKLNFLNENFPEVFYYNYEKFDGLFVTYYLDLKTYEISGYNVSSASKENSELIFMLNEATKDVSEENKEYISKMIKLVENHKE